MGRAGIFSEQDLHSHIDQIKYHGEWGTNTELNMIGALSRIDVISIDVTDVDPNNWNIHHVYVDENLGVQLECDPSNEGQKLWVIYHRIGHQVGMEHFDPFYQYSRNRDFCIPNAREKRQKTRYAKKYAFDNKLRDEVGTYSKSKTMRHVSL